MRSSLHFNNMTKPWSYVHHKTLLKDEMVEIGYSEQQVRRRRIWSFLKRLQQKPNLWNLYQTKRLIPKEKNCCLSNHWLFENFSTTTRLRLLFDGSAKTILRNVLMDGFTVFHQILQSFIDNWNWTPKIKLSSNTLEQPKFNKCENTQYTTVKIRDGIISPSFNSSITTFSGNNSWQKRTASNHNMNVRWWLNNSNTRTVGFILSTSFRGRTWHSEMNF